MKEEQPYIGSPENPKTAAIVCYITFIGWLVAYFALYKDRRTSLVAFHLRQTLMLYLLGFLLNVLLRFTGLLYFALWPVVTIIAIGLFILWLIGLVAAANSRKSLHH